MTFFIRQARTDDVPAIFLIEHRVYPAALAENQEALGARIMISPQTCAVACVDDVLVGYVLAHPWRDNSSPGLNHTLTELPHPSCVLHLHDLAVLPDRRGLGVAQALVAWVTHAAARGGFPRITLVAVGGAETFWRKMGFSDEGPAHGYDDGAIFMGQQVPQVSGDG